MSSSGPGPCNERNETILNMLRNCHHNQFVEILTTTVRRKFLKITIHIGRKDVIYNCTLLHKILIAMYRGIV